MAEIKAMREENAARDKATNERISKIKKSNRAAIAQLRNQQAAPQPKDDDDEEFVEVENDSGGQVDTSGLDAFEIVEDIKNDPMYGPQGLNVTANPVIAGEVRKAVADGIRRKLPKEAVMALGVQALHRRGAEAFVRARTQQASQNPAEKPTGPAPAASPGEPAAPATPSAGLAGGGSPAVAQSAPAIPAERLGNVKGVVPASALPRQRK
jgi:hypothetical protein